jgi:hypothetical protein
MKQEPEPGDDFDLSALRSIGSTGAPLPPEAFDWVYESVSDDLWLCSMSGGPISVRRLWEDARMNRSGADEFSSAVWELIFMRTVMMVNR